MEALRHIPEGDMHRRPPFLSLEKKRHSATIFSARLADETGVLEVETNTYRTDNLVEELSRTQPQVGDNNTVEGHTARDNFRQDAHFELIMFSKNHTDTFLRGN